MWWNDYSQGRVREIAHREPDTQSGHAIRPEGKTNIDIQKQETDVRNQGSFYRVNLPVTGALNCCTSSTALAQWGYCCVSHREASRSPTTQYPEAIGTAPDRVENFLPHSNFPEV